MQGRSASHQLAAEKTTERSTNHHQPAEYRLTLWHTNQTVIKFQPTHSRAWRVLISYT